MSFNIQGKCLENKDFCLSFKQDWNGAPVKHEIKRPGRQKKNNKISALVSQITKKWKEI
jgi:hypothetical protein